MYKRTSIIGLIVALALCTPSFVHAATLLGSRTMVVSEPVSENLYLAGSDITIAAPLAADLVSAGGTVTVSAPIAGDALLTGATISIKKPVNGDVRAIGGEVVVDSLVGGDLMLAGATVQASTTALDTHIAGGTVRVSGSGGALTVYGADVDLAGTLRGDVTIVASDKLIIEEGTHIEGVLKYDAPQEVVVPASATITGGVVYTGSSAFLPTNEEAKQFAIAGAGVLLVTRIIAIVIAAGVVVGLFPILANMVVDRTIRRTPRRFVLLSLLGFAAIVATPLLILFLLVSFVGFALAILLACLYVLLLLLAYLYAGLISGAAIAQALFKKDRISWRTAVLGTLALYVVGSVPLIGTLVVLIITSAALGSLMAIVYRASFGVSTEPQTLLPSEDITH